MEGSLTEVAEEDRAYIARQEESTIRVQAKKEEQKAGRRFRRRR